MERFADSIEATEFFEKLQAMVNDPRAAEWLHATDSNFSVSTVPHFKQAKQLINFIVNKLDHLD